MDVFQVKHDLLPRQLLSVLHAIDDPEHPCMDAACSVGLSPRTVTSGVAIIVGFQPFQKIVPLGARFDIVHMPAAIPMLGRLKPFLDKGRVVIVDLELKLVLAVVDACCFLSDLCIGQKQAWFLRLASVTDVDSLWLEKCLPVDGVSNFGWKV